MCIYVCGCGCWKEEMWKQKYVSRKLVAAVMHGMCVYMLVKMIW